MIEFRRTILPSEANLKYLNLTDEDGKTYGKYLSNIPHASQMAIVDGANRVTFALKHHNNQVWGSLRKWYGDNNIQAGSRILIRFDPEETEEDLPVLHLIPEIVPEPAPAADLVQDEFEQNELNTEIPVSLEKQLEDFLQSNLDLVEKGLTLYSDESGHEGRQYPTDVGIIDLLCVRPNGDYLVLELKRGKAADKVVGQISRYVGWVKKNIADNKQVHGLILSHKSNKDLEYAVLANPNLSLQYFRLKLELLPMQEIEL